MSNTVNTMEQIGPMLDGAVIGGLGGLVNHLRRRKSRDWGQLFVAVLTAGFAGMLAQLVSGWMNLDIRLQFAVAGIAGYGGGVLLDDIVTRFRNIVNAGAGMLEEKVERAANRGENHG